MRSAAIFTAALPGRDLRVGYDRLKAIREAVGDQIDIIVEAHALTDTTSAIEFGRMIEEFRISAYEEPVMSLNPMQLKEVHDNVNIPIAAGERVFTRWGFRPFFENHIIDLIQPDLGTCGGFTEGKKICDMGHIYDTTAQIHVCGGPIMTAASLQLEAAPQELRDPRTGTAMRCSKATAGPASMTTCPSTASIRFRICPALARN